MSSAQLAAKSIRELEEEDWLVLRVLENSLSRYESVPINRIKSETGFNSHQLGFRLGKLNRVGFVMRSLHGYMLNTAGLDALALNSLAEKKLVSGMGAAIGMGKESDVFEVINDIGVESVIKFYRIGRTSFRKTRKTRAYTTPQNQHQWLAINISAAQKEAEGLTRAENAEVNVPHFIARDRHAVLMSKIEGLMLYRCSREDVSAPEKLMEDIFRNLRKAYTGAKIINGDVSEYNILYDGSQPWVIDWPQFVGLSHENAKDFLRRDVENVTKYFKKKFNLKADVKGVIEYISGKMGSRTLKFENYSKS